MFNKVIVTCSFLIMFIFAINKDIHLELFFGFQMILFTLIEINENQ